MVSDTASSDWIISQVVIYERKKEDYKHRVWRPWIWRVILWGLPLILLWGILGVYVPVIVAELQYQARLTRKNVDAVIPAGVVPHLSFVSLPVWVEGFALEIPEIGVRERVIEAVDVVHEDVYMNALKEGIAHAAGSGLPGEGRTQYYFAHSSGLPFWGQRAVVFALLNRLENGDVVVVYRDNKKYEYIVTQKQVVKPEDVTWLVSQSTEEQVVLQTCWPIGTNWKRLLVVAKPISLQVSGVDSQEAFGKISFAMRGTK